MKIYIFIILITAAIFIAGISAVSAAPIGSVLNFDGNDYLTVTDSAVLDQANQLSLSVWVKPDTTPSADAYIIYRGNGYYLKQNTSNQIVGAIYYSSAFQTITSPAIILGQWTHIELTYNKDAGGVDELKLYINSVLSAVGDHSTAISDASTALYIGCQNSTPTNCFDGKIDDFRLYQYARTADEVKADYNNGLASHLGKDSQRDDGLVGYWNMEEGKGQTVYDRSGNGNNGTLGASTAVAKDDPVFTSGYSSAGPGGTALKFDGKDDYVDAGNGASLNITQNITVEAWVKLNNSAVSNRIASKHGSGYGWTFGNNGNKMLFGFSTTGADWNEWLGNTSLSSSVWYHFAAVRDYTNSKVYFYLNGVSDRTPVDFSGQINIAGVNTRIGKDGFCAGTGCPFSGSLDDIRIYNRALSADEIRQHYNQKKPILDMKFDEGSGTSTKDESFNNNDGVLYSGATSCSNPPTAGCPAWTTGKYGSAIQFDGTDDYVSVPNSASLNITGDMTIGLWFYVAAWPSSNYPGLISKRDTYASMDWELYYDKDGGTNRIKFIYGNSGANILFNALNVNPSLSVWHYIIVTRNGNNWTLYLDGINRGTETNTGVMPTGDNIRIGRLGGDDASDYFSGTIDSVRVYNYARTSAEILVDYNNGLAAHIR